jgi:hypothetical protein
VISTKDEEGVKVTYGDGPEGAADELIMTDELLATELRLLKLVEGTGYGLLGLIGAFGVVFTSGETGSAAEELETTELEEEAEE